MHSWLWGRKKSSRRCKLWERYLIGRIWCVSDMYFMSPCIFKWKWYIPFYVFIVSISKICLAYCLVQNICVTESSEIIKVSTIFSSPIHACWFSCCPFDIAVGQMYTPHSPASSITPILDMENGVRVLHNWHLVKKQDHDSLRKGDKYHTLMAEIYLPRLLTTKASYITVSYLFSVHAPISAHLVKFNMQNVWNCKGM